MSFSSISIYFLSQFVIHILTGCIIFLLPCWIISLFWKKRKRVLLKIGLTLSLILSVIVTLNDIREIQSKPSFSLNKITLQDKTRMDQIVQGIGQNNPEFLTPKIHAEFWSILDKYGKMSNSDVNTVRDQFSGVNVYMKYFWSDALESYKLGKTYKSKERMDYEQNLIKKGYFTDYDIKRNDQEMESIALHQPVVVNSQKVIFNEELINASIENTNSSNDRYKLLYTR